MMHRDFLQSIPSSAIGFGAIAQLVTTDAFGKEPASVSSAPIHSDESFWPDGAGLAVSISMQFEAGAQPERGAESPFPPLDTRYQDLPAETWYAYGVNERIPRLLDLWDRKKIKVTSHMVGQAVDRKPQLAKEIVERGHEAAGHGQTWAPRYSMSREEEKTSYQASVNSTRAPGLPARTRSPAGRWKARTPFTGSDDRAK
jgi:peptidoglycan/xylan/chitin deacetylase (PgdA/CDA1 family)